MLFEIVYCIVGVDILCIDMVISTRAARRGRTKGFPVLHQPSIAQRTTASLSSAKDSTFESRGKVFTWALWSAEDDKRSISGKPEYPFQQSCFSAATVRWHGDDGRWEALFDRGLERGGAERLDYKEVNGLVNMVSGMTGILG